jgi:hypothetical protein
MPEKMFEDIARVELLRSFHKLLAEQGILTGP